VWQTEVILLSFVRSSSLGFCDEPNRMNVALTRAKRHLVIIGTKSVLAQSGKWRSVIQAIRNSKWTRLPFSLEHLSSFLLVEECLSSMVVLSIIPYFFVIVAGDSSESMMDFHAALSITEFSPTDIILEANDGGEKEDMEELG
jgi:hypothetical protein